MHRGYFALWRKIQDHPFYKERRKFSKYEAWLDLLMEAQHDIQPHKVTLGMKVLTQYYGECLKSNVTWGKRWGWSEPKVRRFMKMLEEMKQIRRKSEGITTRITILNYGIYDPKRRRNDEQTTSKRRRRDEQATTNNNDNNEKNEKNVKKATTPSDSKKKSEERLPKKNTSLSETIPLNIPIPKFESVNDSVKELSQQEKVKRLAKLKADLKKAMPDEF